MKLLITGGSGFIGRNLVEYLAPNYQVLAPSSSELNLLDSLAVRQYLCTNHFDAVVHAATTRSNRRLGAPPDILERNCRMFFNLARNDGLFGRLIHFGSGAEYERISLPARVGEDYFDVRVPSDLYGFSKYVCAKYIERSERMVNLRLFGVYGKYEDYTVRFISNACCRMLKGLPILIRQDVVFDYLYVEDLAKITVWFLEHQPRHKAYNVCTGRGMRLTQLADIVGGVSGLNPQIIVRKDGLDSEYTADNSLLQTELSGYTFRDVRTSIGELYWSYARQEQGIAVDSLRFDE